MEDVDNELIVCEETDGLDMGQQQQKIDEHNHHAQQQQQQHQYTWNDQLQNVLIVNDGDLVLCSTQEDYSKDTKGSIFKIMPPLTSLASAMATGDVTTTSTLPNTSYTSVTLPPLHTTISSSHHVDTTLATTIDKQIIVKKQKRTVPFAVAATEDVNATQRYTCPRCGKDYSQSKNMRRHYRLECGQEPKYPCQYCQLRFKRNNQLKNHIQSRHSTLNISSNDNSIVVNSNIKIESQADIVF